MWERQAFRGDEDHLSFGRPLFRGHCWFSGPTQVPRKAMRQGLDGIIGVLKDCGLGVTICSNEGMKMRPPKPAWEIES